MPDTEFWMEDRRDPGIGSDELSVYFILHSWSRQAWTSICILAAFVE